MLHRYNLPPYIAALRLFNELRDYNKIGGLKKEVSRLCQQIFVVNGICSNQNQALAALVKLQSHGITEPANNVIEKLFRKHKKKIKNSLTSTWGYYNIHENYTL